MRCSADNSLEIPPKIISSVFVHQSLSDLQLANPQGFDKDMTRNSSETLTASKFTSRCVQENQ